jgi:regulator of PEP synthase PpsR (kinase-PPPase family)
MRPSLYFHVHLISDSTGETLNALLRAAIGQFDNAVPLEHSYYLVRSKRQLDRVLVEIAQSPGIVLMTVSNHELRSAIEDHCRANSVPCMPVLDSVIDMMQRYLGIARNDRVGARNVFDDAYSKRIDALNYAMTHDDGQMVHEFDQADVVLVGVSRTSKTPTSIYLANRGVKAANFPLVPGNPVPESLVSLTAPLVVGLKVSPDRLISIRRNRLLSLNADPESEYVDEESVRTEVMDAARLYERAGWPVIDVTRRSIEETAAAIMNLMTDRTRHV